MMYRKLLIIPAILLLMGCNPAYLNNDNYAAETPYAAADSWYWDNSCNCWVNQAYQTPPVTAPLPANTTAPCGNCMPTQRPQPPYCPPGSPCQTMPKAALPLIQTNAITTAPVTASLPPALPATMVATPQYWDPRCQCWADARYVDNSPVRVPAPAPSDTEALIIARNAQRTAEQALQESLANTERLNRAYRRSLEK
jgi:hypothetical protein